MRSDSDPEEELELEEVEPLPLTLDPPEEPEEGRVGRYRLIRRLGTGGMAIVWLGEDGEGLQLAVKVFQPRDPDPQGLARFQREYLALRRLTHPNVVSVRDAGVHDGRPWFAMEFVDGQDLRKERKALAALPASERFTRIRHLFVQLCRALAYIHGAGLVHRDLKPSNVLIKPDGTLKLTDFGIARDLMDPQHLTAPGQFLGTVTHIAPEQIQGLPVDHRADLYSLGVLLYELLTGQRPFVANDSLGYAYLHAYRTPTPPRSLDLDIPPELEQVALRLLHKSPADRFQSAQDALLLLDGGALHELLPAPLAAAQVPWIGRWAELEFVHQLLSRPTERCGQIVCIEGPWGIGKTRLVREVLLRLPLQGVGVSEGYTAGSALPYEAFQGVVEQALREIREEGDRRGNHLLERIKPALDWAFPQAFGEDPPTILELRLERYRTAMALMDLLVFLAVRRPRVVFLDEIQRADRASRELVAFLARELSNRRVPVTFVVTLEPGDSPPLPLIGRKQHPLVTHISLFPLQQEEMTSLLKVLVGTGPLIPLEELARGAQGRPGFAVELASAWRSQRKVVEGPRELPPIPPVVREAVLESLAYIHMPGVEVIALLAALGREANAQFLRSVLIKKESVLIKRLEQLEAEGWLTVRQWEGAEQWDLPSWVARKVVYESLSEATRQDLHGRLANTLARKGAHETPDDLASLADQLHQAGRFDEAWPRHIQAAVVMLERRSARAALIHLNRAEAIADRLTHLEDAAEQLREERARVMRLKGQAQVAIGSTAAGLRSLRNAVRLAERLDRTGMVAMARYALGTALVELDLLDEAEPELESAARLWEEADNMVAYAATRVSLAELYIHRGKPGQSETPLRQAMTLATLHDSRSLLADALAISGSAGFARGDGIAAMDALVASEAEYRAMQARTGLAQCLTSRAEIAWWLGDLHTSVATAEEASRLARETDLRFQLTRCQWVLGMGRFERGRWDDAATLFEQVVELATKPNYIEIKAAGEVWRAWVALGRGDPGSALHWLTERAPTRGGWTRTAIACRAWALAALGRLDEARPLLVGLEESVGPLAPQVVLRVAMGWATLLLGDAHEAHALGDRALKRAYRMGLRPAALQACLLLLASARQLERPVDISQHQAGVQSLVHQLSLTLPPDEAQQLRLRPDLVTPSEAAA